MRILLCYPPVSEEYDKIRDAGVTPHLSLLCLASHILSKFDDVKVDIIELFICSCPIIFYFFY